MHPASLRMWAQPTPLANRASELETIRRRLADEGVRLLTLTGPAGVGKTRLALAAAAQLTDRFLDGVGLVDLAPLRDSQLVLPTLAHALGVTDTGHEPLLKRLQAVLGERALLLVLDNFEQVLAAAAPLAELLAACPGLVLLVTSRVPLQLPAEQTLRVPPLSVPDLTTALPPLDELVRVPAVALFVERARARRADFALSAAQAPLAAQLVVQLDGLPLALELAAARLDALSLPMIARRLEDRLRLLRWEAADVPARQRSLEAAIGWSYALLSVGEQRLFRHLGVFAGRVALAAIAAVAGGAGDQGDEGGKGGTLAGMASLEEKSLVLPERQEDVEDAEDQEDQKDAEDQKDTEGNEEKGEPAFSMLETVRAYAGEQLAAAQGELEAARRAHAHYFLALAERADPLLRQHGQRAWFLRLEHEHANLRAALRWLLDQEAPAEREQALRLAGALSYFWFVRGYHAEGWRWLEEALARAPAADPGVRTQALIRAGRLVTVRGDYDRAQAILEEALALAEQRHDRPGIVEALTQMGARAAYAGDIIESVRLLRAGLRRAQEMGDPFWIGHAYVLLSMAAVARGDYAQAAACSADALDRFQQVGDVRFASLAHYGLTLAQRELGELPRAIAHARESLQASAYLKERWLIAIGAQGALWLVGERADLSQRARLLGAVDALNQAIGAPLSPWVAVMRQRLAALRERLDPDRLGAAYREGRSLPLGEVVALAGHLLEDLARSLAAEPLAGTGRPDALQEQSEQPEGLLSAREREMLRQVAQGLSNQAIARQLVLSPNTVSHLLTAIFRKLGVKSRAQAVAVAAQRGLL